MTQRMISCWNRGVCSLMAAALKGPSLHVWLGCSSRNQSGPHAQL